MTWWQRFLQRMRTLVPEEDREDFDELAGEMEEAAPAPDAGGDGGADEETTASSSSEVSAAVEQALAPVQEQLKALQDALADEKEARQQAVEQLEEQQAARREEEIAETLDAAVEDGRITTEEREKWKERLEKDFDGYSETLAERPASEAALASGSDDDEGSGEDDSPSSGDAATPTAPARGGFMDYVNDSQARA
jgi:chromosome segregation ATPase